MGEAHFVGDALVFQNQGAAGRIGDYVESIWIFIDLGLESARKRHDSRILLVIVKRDAISVRVFDETKDKSAVHGELVGFEFEAIADVSFGEEVERGRVQRVGLNEGRVIADLRIEETRIGRLAKLGATKPTAALTVKSSLRTLRIVTAAEVAATD